MVSARVKFPKEQASCSAGSFPFMISVCLCVCNVCFSSSQTSAQSTVLGIRSRGKGSLFMAMQQCKQKPWPHLWGWIHLPSLHPPPLMLPAPPPKLLQELCCVTQSWKCLGELLSSTFDCLSTRRWTQLIQFLPKSG